MLSSIISAIASAIGNSFTMFSGLFTGVKLLATGLMFITLPLILKNVIGWWCDNSANAIQSKLSTLPGLDSLPSLTYQFTGLAGYFASHFRIIDCVSVLLTGLLMHITLRFIPGF
jgi:hypothetical protein